MSLNLIVLINVLLINQDHRVPTDLSKIKICIKLTEQHSILDESPFEQNVSTQTIVLPTNRIYGKRESTVSGRAFFL